MAQVVVAITGANLGQVLKARPSASPYIDNEDLSAEQFLFGSLQAKGRYVGAAITAATWVVTVPAGSEFVVPTPDGATRVKLGSAVTITGDATNNKISLVVGLKGDGTYGALLVADTAGVPGGLLLGTVNISTWTDDGQLQKTSVNRRVYSVHVPSLTVDQSVYVAVANGGLVKKLSVVSPNQPTATVTFTGKIAAVAITGGAPTLASTDTAGTVKSVLPTAANIVAAGGAIEVAMGHGTNATAGTAVVTIEVDE